MRAARVWAQIPNKKGRRIHGEDDLQVDKGENRENQFVSRQRNAGNYVPGGRVGDCG
jgi:hypothetical protein